MAEAGFTRYEFGRWKTKDIGAIAKANEELGLQAALFTGYPGLRGARWKEGLLEAATDSAELGPRLGALKVGVMAAERDEAVDRREQVEGLVDALEEAAGLVANSEVVLVLEPIQPLPGKPTSLIGTVEEAAAVVKAVGSDRLKFAFPIDRAAVLDPALVDRIEQQKGRTGYYRLVDFAPPDAATGPAYVRALRAIQATGYAEPVGLGLAPKGDPLAAIEAIRKLDGLVKGP